MEIDPELMYSVLKARPDKPRKKMIESVYAHVATLETLNVSTDFVTVSESLRKGFIDEFGISEQNLLDPTLNLQEKKYMDALIYQRYKSWNWTEDKLDSVNLEDLSN